jgi:hypothetical protein
MTPSEGGLVNCVICMDGVPPKFRGDRLWT